MELVCKNATPSGKKPWNMPSLSMILFNIVLPITNKIVIIMNVFYNLVAVVHRLATPTALVVVAWLFVMPMTTAQVTMKLDPASVEAEVGDDNVEMKILLQTGEQPVDGVDLNLNFDPAVLQVISLTQGTSLPLSLVPPTADNNVGTITYAAGTVSNFPSGDLTILSIVFEVIGGSPSPSQITFNEQVTLVTFGGDLLSITFENGEVVIPSETTEANFTGTVTLVGDCTNLPSTLSIYEAGTDVLVRSQNVSGNSFNVLGLDPSLNYDIYVKTERYLQSKLENVQLQALPGENNLDFGPQIPGDVNDDNQVTGEDYVLLKNSYDLSVEDPGFNEMADFNCDNFISGEDYVFLKVNFNKIGEQP